MVIAFLLLGLLNGINPGLDSVHLAQKYGRKIGDR